MATNQNYAGTWRCWASMSIDGDERIPMLFRLWPEPWDNSIKYNSTNNWNVIKYNNETGKFDISIRDNGNGFSEEGESRFLQLAAENDANEASRYGWGLKAFIASACPNYTDNWEIGTRYINTARPTIYKGPYKEKYTKCTPGQSDFLFPSGTKITVSSDRNRFATSKISYDTTAEMAALFKELVCTRYSEEVLRTVRFHFNITGTDGTSLEMDSWTEEWHSLEYNMKLAVEQKFASVLIPETIRNFDENGNMKVRHVVYQINPISKKKNANYGPLNDFPLYGRRNMDSTLIHHFNNQRMIETIPKGVATGKHFHNSENGQIGFVQFLPANPDTDYALMPRPATIKTTYLTTTIEWKTWMNMLRDIYNESSRIQVADSDSQESASEPSEIIIPNPNQTLFADDPTLQKRYLAEKDKGSNVETYTSPSWTGLPMGFKTIENGFHTIVLHRQKMKDVETDFMKAHLAACEYANEHSLEPANLQFIILLSIKEPKKRSERMEALRELKTRISGKYFPLAERIEFGLEA
jgi:hypothetical protein